MKTIQHQGGVDDVSLLEVAGKAFRQAFNLTMNENPSVVRSDMEIAISLPNEERKPSSEVRIIVMAKEVSVLLYATVIIMVGSENEDWIPYQVTVWGEGGKKNFPQHQFLIT